MRITDPTPIHGTRGGTPSACPVCGSREMTTTGKAVTAESYWRCVSCGEVWNHTRRETARVDRTRWFPAR